MRLFVLLAIGLTGIAQAGNSGVLIKEVPQIETNKPGVVAAVKQAFLSRRWNVESSDETSVIASLDNDKTSARMRVSIEGRSLVYEETTTQMQGNSHAPTSVFVERKRPIKLGVWLENIRRDVTVTLAAVPIHNPGPSDVAKAVSERLKALDALRAAGAITDDEYKNKRAEILKAI